MRSRIAWLVVIAAACFVPYSVGRIGWLSAAPPENAPVVLHYSETPIFLGPHEHAVAAIAFSPDGKTIATGSSGFLRLWDAGTGHLRSIHGEDETRGIGALAFSPDGKRVATVGAFFGKDFVVWDAASGRIVEELDEQANGADALARSATSAPMIYKGKPINFHPQNGVAFSPDGRILATGGDGVMLRDAQSGKLVTTLKQPAKGVSAIAFSPDGKTLVTASEDKKVRLWSIPDGALETTLDGPTQPLHGVAISHDGRHIAAAGSGRRSILSRDETPAGYLWSWELPSGKAQKVELGNVNVRQVAFAGPTTVLVAAGNDLMSIDLQASDSQRPRTLWSHNQQVMSVAVSPDGRLIASGGADRDVDVIESSSGKLVYRLPGLTDLVSSVATSSDGKRFATASLDIRFSVRVPSSEDEFEKRFKTYFSNDSNAGRIKRSEVRVWSTQDGRMQSMLPLPSSQVTALDFVPNGDQLVVAGWRPGKGGMLSLWDVGAGKLVRDFASSPSEVLSVAVSVDGQVLASGDGEGNLDLWDVQSGKKLHSHKHDQRVRAVALSDDGKLVATGDVNRTVRIFDASSGAIVRTLKSRSRIESLDFSPDAKLLAAGTRSPGLELWDLGADTASQTLTATGDHFDAMPGFVAFSPDGQFVVCGGRGKNIAVFNASKGTLYGELQGHFHAPTAARFLPNGRLVSGAEERTVRLWDTKGTKGLATWFVVPADQSRNWDDQWVGFKPSGEYVGSKNLDRLVGWESGGDVIPGAEGATRRRVDSLFQPNSAVSSARQ